VSRIALGCFLERVVLRNVLLGAFVIGWMGSLAAWVAVVVYGLGVLRNVLPGVSLWSSQFAYNPANVVFHPELLTRKGVFYRRRLGWAVAVFVGLVLGSLLLGALTGSLRG
jgi:hypothetical protein